MFSLFIWRFFFFFAFRGMARGQEMVFEEWFSFYYVMQMIVSKTCLPIGELQVEGLAFCSATLLGGAHPSCFLEGHWWRCSASWKWASSYPSWVGWFYSHRDRGTTAFKSSIMGVLYLLSSLVLFLVGYELLNIVKDLGYVKMSIIIWSLSKAVFGLVLLAFICFPLVMYV